MSGPRLELRDELGQGLTLTAVGAEDGHVRLRVDAAAHGFSAQTEGEFEPDAFAAFWLELRGLATADDPACLEAVAGWFRFELRATGAGRCSVRDPRGRRVEWSAELDFGAGAVDRATAEIAAFVAAYPADAEPDW